ncbi:transposase [Streptomyces vinaceus]
MIAPLVGQGAPELLGLNGVGPEAAGQLLVTAGQNPQRLWAEAVFAVLCGVAPLPASSGRIRRHRLNRGGDRQANSALHRIVICRLRWDQRGRTYVERRAGEGMSKTVSMGCLKRHVARDICNALTRQNIHAAASGHSLTAAA